MLTKIKKRNGQVVDFKPEKIKDAAGKAFAATMGSIDDGILNEITHTALEAAERAFNGGTPSVENIQDMVEKTIMQKGYYDVAKAYILYRYEHSKDRIETKKKTLKKIERNNLVVTKRSGEKEKFSLEKLRKSISFAAKDIENIVDLNAIVIQCQAELYDGITSTEIDRALMMAARSFIEKDPAYSTVAARLLLNIMYKETLGRDTMDYERLYQQYRQMFVDTIEKGVEMGKLDKRLLTFNLWQLSAVLEPSRDDDLKYLGLQTLYDRYFLTDPKTNKILETPQIFWMRVAMGLALNEEKKESWAIKFYELMSTLRYLPSTPTLFHAGTLHPQLSSCYLNTVDDSLTHIFKVVGDNAQLSKWSGGIGTDWTNIRATGSFIKGTGVESQGVIPFLKIANDTTVAINRSGRRRGATCVYLETWHFDIEDFLELRKNTGDDRRRTHDMNTANWVPDLFMKRVIQDGEWTLFSPHETPELHDTYGKEFERIYEEYEKKAAKGKLTITKKVRARDLWKKMLSMLFETGHPWITFKDACNIRSPQDHMGVIHNSNLCTEITLNTSHSETAVCNLGSINLGRHIHDGKMNSNLLKETVETAMRILDNVIDLNFYPTEEAKNANMKHRPVGLGIMGFQDALYLQNIPFDSEACVTFADTNMEFIAYHAILTSTELARERGKYPSFTGSKWDRGLLPIDTLDLLEKEREILIEVNRSGALGWNVVREAIKTHGMRNSNCMAIAPTATISNIAGCFPTIEPIYKNIYVKSNQSGDFVIVNPYLIEDLKAKKLWDYEMLGKIKYNDGNIAKITEIPIELKEKYKEVFDISSDWLIKIAAHRGKWIDQSQSLNLFFKGTSGKILSDAYIYAWKLGLKTTYYLRTLAASQVEKSTVDTALYGSTHVREQKQENIPVAVTQNEPMLATCKIDDPECEACQ